MPAGCPGEAHRIWDAGGERWGEPLGVPTSSLTASPPPGSSPHQVPVTWLPCLSTPGMVRASLLASLPTPLIPPSILCTPLPLVRSLCPRSPPLSHLSESLSWWDTAPPPLLTSSSPWPLKEEELPSPGHGGWGGGVGQGKWAALGARQAEHPAWQGTSRPRELGSVSSIPHAPVS